MKGIKKNIEFTPRSLQRLVGFMNSEMHILQNHQIDEDSTHYYTLETLVSVLHDCGLCTYWDESNHTWRLF